MLSFENDYSEGAHEKVLQRLVETNLDQQPGYGKDQYCRQARKKIQKICQRPVEVEFLTGGTQTNQLVIDSLLKPYEGVISADTGHIGSHEAGAIEYSGHKVITLASSQGKISAYTLTDHLTTFFADENHEQMVFPGIVYISYPTEYGTLYSKKELEELAEICRQYHLTFYIDGARLGYGLMSEQADITMADIASIADVFYIGGTKVGALCGEAIVFTRKNKPEHFSSIVKQHGGLLAKGRLLGIQFDALFTENLYFTIAEHAVKMARLLKKGLLKKNYSLYIDSPTNQQFVIIENEKLQELQKQVRFTFWEKQNDHQTVIRLATSWATKKEEVEQLLDLL